MKKSDAEGKTITESKLSLFDFSRHGETPNDEQINLFISICNEFSTTNPDDIIGMMDFSS
jgi:hypothetical protein